MAWFSIYDLARENLVSVVLLCAHCCAITTLVSEDKPLTYPGSRVKAFLSVSPEIDQLKLLNCSNIKISKEIGRNNKTVASYLANPLMYGTKKALEGIRTKDN